MKEESRQRFQIALAFDVLFMVYGVRLFTVYGVHRCVAQCGAVWRSVWLRLVLSLMMGGIWGHQPDCQMKPNANGSALQCSRVQCCAVEFSAAH